VKAEQVKNWLPEQYIIKANEQMQLSLVSIVPPFRKRSLKANSLVMKRALLLMQGIQKKVFFNQHTRVQYF